MISNLRQNTLQLEIRDLSTPNYIYYKSGDFDKTISIISKIIFNINVGYNLVTIILCLIITSLKSINKCTKTTTKQYYLLNGQAILVHIRKEIFEIKISSII